ncbi:MAG: hypothetical protein Fur005_26690 [Roseiflexaceae bacterium]
MYNGNGYGSYNGRKIPALYLYIGLGVLALVALWLVSSFIRAGVEGYFTLAAGVLLIFGNLRDVINNPRPGRENIALLNTMIGGGLVMYFLGRGGFPPIGWIWFIPAIALVALAAPLMLGRAGVYQAYLTVARDTVSNVRRMVGSIVRP